jgi:hypothetical protein
MRHKNNAAPETITLTEEESDALKLRLNNKQLDDEDYALLLKILNVVFWLQSKVAHYKISLSKLGSLFGVTKKSAQQQTTTAESGQEIDTKDAPAPTTSKSILSEKPDAKKPRANGRISAQDYKNKTRIEVNHDELCKGSDCPACKRGRLYPAKRGIEIRLVGQNDQSVQCYELEKLRCHSCGEQFTASMPAAAPKAKTDAHFNAQVAVKKYYLGVPFYTQERYQAMVGTPISDSSLWLSSEVVADCTYPILGQLEKRAVLGDLLHYDDTWHRILSRIQHLKDNPEEKRKGTYTTGVVANFEGHPIYLFYTGKQHAGENMNDLLAKRPKDLPPIKTMCDALAANLSHEFKTIVINCLSHGLRKFSDIESYFPDDCSIVLSALGDIYANDRATHEMDDKTRLAYHQAYSQPILETLHQTLQQKMDNHEIEPNSHLGSAVNYLLKHWQALTEFIRVEGAPLDNNICEQALKKMIKLRKTAMFFKTEHGAYVGSLLLSLIATCEANQVNPIDYLVACQQYKSQLFKEPHRFLPWNYTQVIDATRQAA